MNLNIILSIFTIILVIRGIVSQYGDIEEDVKGIKAYQKELYEFVQKYTEDNDQFKKTQYEAGKGKEFDQFVTNVLNLYSKTLRDTSDVIKDLESLRNAPKDIAGDAVKLHFKFIELKENWNTQFKKLWADYSVIVNKLSEESEGMSSKAKETLNNDAKGEQEHKNTIKITRSYGMNDMRNAERDL